ncbi:MAG: M23 family metallopeptidase [Gemmatimonadetes bacterium]|nr:M23 family metallopeptidase [Gemmatimonadota bacterium]
MRRDCRRHPRPLALALQLALLAGCALPRWPVEGPITSPFGIRWRGWLPELHGGVDIAIPGGSPVRAMAPGTVRFAGELGAYGTVVILEHRGGWTTLYAHLSELRVQAGQRLGSGDVIGLSGHSGDARAPHLHFEIRAGDRPRDPVLLLGGRPAPR